MYSCCTTLDEKSTTTRWFVVFAQHFDAISLLAISQLRALKIIKIKIGNFKVFILSHTFFKSFPFANAIEDAPQPFRSYLNAMFLMESRVN